MRVIVNGFPSDMIPIERGVRQGDSLLPMLYILCVEVLACKIRACNDIGKVLILNVLGLSKLLYLSRVLIPPRWMLDKYNSLIWPFLWGAKLEPVARRSIICSPGQGGLFGLKERRCAYPLSSLLQTLVLSVFISSGISVVRVCQLYAPSGLLYGIFVHLMRLRLLNFIYA